MAKRLVMYCRDSYCPDQARARQLLQDWGVPYKEVNISRNAWAAARSALSI
jgi:glutaredoxin